MHIVLPGDVIASADERIPGEGAYRDGDVLRSEYIGILMDDGHVVKVKPFRRPMVPRVGSVVVGYVMAIIRGKILQIQVYNLDGRIVQQPFTVIVRVPVPLLLALPASLAVALRNKLGR